MPQPKISIVTPSFNQAAFLERTIESVLGQHYANLEYRVLDGGSTDGSVDVLQKYDDKLTSWVSEPDEGQADAIARGLAQCTGEIFAYLNSDDIYYPGALEAAAAFFESHPDVDLVYGDAIHIDAEDRALAIDVLPAYRWEDLRRVCIIPQMASFWRRSAYERVGGIDAKYQFALDYEFFLRLGEKGKIAHLPKVLAGFRRHQAAKTARSKETWAKENSELSVRYLGRDGWNRADWLRMKWLTARQIGAIAGRSLKGEKFPCLTPVRWNRAAKRKLAGLD